MSDSQEALIPDPNRGGFYARYKDGDRVNHAAWLRACAEHGLVGTCRQCGNQLAPERPVDNRGRVDYTARCVACPWEQTAPGGRLAKRKAR